MTDPIVALVTVASPSYMAFADDLMESAEENIRGVFDWYKLAGEEGWPCGTECRHGIFANWLTNGDEYDVAFLLDADMLVEEPFDLADILPPKPGIVATLHPGYVGMPRHILPYESRPESRAFIPDDQGDFYYAGGVIGGTREELLVFSRCVDQMIRDERDDGREVAWHDESCVNAILAVAPPVLTLDPSFAHPDADAHYVRNIWGGRDYPRHIVCLDKAPAERVGR